jgi:protein-L-isoaspartate(D-aspartate) O-methyltransferase
MTDFQSLRSQMVEQQIGARGIRSKAVLDAMRSVPREAFLEDRAAEFAYEDTPLPIAADQTISQPFIVALMIEALGLVGGEKVLEIGTGSGYAAAVLSLIAADVHSVERISLLSEAAAVRLASLGYGNVHVHHADGTLGWPEDAPFDAIIVTAGGPSVPDSLKRQLKVGGRLVIPVGNSPRAQELMRVTRISEDNFKTEELADVCFVPLVGLHGWSPEQATPKPARGQAAEQAIDTSLAKAVAAHCEIFDSIESANLDALLERIGDARIVLLGEASHGTSEFYRMRARISQELIARKGFQLVAIEGDWPDVSRLDQYVRFDHEAAEWSAFARFPQWMWRNEDMRSFVEWLRTANAGKARERRTALHGLDLYSLFTSIEAVLEYLDKVDPEAAGVARQRYGCLTPWQSEPANYGHAALTGAYRTCEPHVVRMLQDLLRKRSTYAPKDAEQFMDAVQNARLVADAERYYRIMYYGSNESWNLRDTHMFETLQALLGFHGPESKAIVWAHNSHVGDASATEMAARGEFNIGQLCRERFATSVYSIGFGTSSGTVAAATEWDGPMEVKTVRPALAGSYEKLFHETARPRFMLPLRGTTPAALRRELQRPRLERAIGVIYRPETELASHYFQASLPRQFDEYIWFDETRAVSPLATSRLAGVPDTFPSGL